MQQHRVHPVKGAAAVVQKLRPSQAPPRRARHHVHGRATHGRGCDAGAQESGREVEQRR